MKKQIALIWLLLASITFGNPVLFAEEVFKSANELADWVMYYYQKPEPEKISEAIRVFSDTDFYKSNKAEAVTGFFSVIFKKDPILMGKTFEEIELNGSDNSKKTVVAALVHAHTPESKKYLEKALRTWKIFNKNSIDGLEPMWARTPDSFSQRKIEGVRDAYVLDMLWAEFMATGDEAPVKTIISHIHKVKETDVEPQAIGRVALWSLAANAKQHARVCQICKEAFKTSEGTTKELLGTITCGAESAATPKV